MHALKMPLPSGLAEDALLRNSAKSRVQCLYDYVNSSLFNEHFQDLALLATNCFKNGGTIYLAGNGGSFTQAQHIAAEFTVKYKKDRPPLRSVTLGSNPAHITACSNDYSYESIFSRELKGQAQPGRDVLIAISTSGSSKNILELLEVSAQMSIERRLLSSNRCSDIHSHNVIKVPTADTDTAQEMHLVLLHSLCEAFEQ